MKFNEYIKWRIVAKDWIEDTPERWRVCHSVTLTNRHYKYITPNITIEEVDADNEQWDIDFFVAESKDKRFKFSGSLNKCLRMVKWMEDDLKWEDWEWTNAKFGKIDSIEVVEDEE